MSVEVYFMGGPADGQHRAIECADPMDPPLTQTVITPPDLRTLAADDPVVPVEHTYRRQVSQTDDGPAWVYAWQTPPESVQP